jgi:hypothetical protein
VCRRRTSAATAATSTGLVVSTVISGPMPTGRSVVFFHRGQRQRPLVDLRVEAGLDHHVARAGRERPQHRKRRGAQPPRPSSVEPALARDVQGVVQRHLDHVLGHQRVAELRCQREGEAALPAPGLPEIYTIWMTTGGVLSRWRICGFDLAFDFSFRKSGTRLQRHSLEDDKEDRREYRYQADDPEGHRIRRLTRFNAADTVLLLRLEVPRVMTAQYQRAHRKR